jgi:hypothetical protein
MKSRKIRPENDAETKALSSELRERLDLIYKEMDRQPGTLDSLFTGTDEFHQLYVQPLLEAGLTLQDSFALLAVGVLRPN